MLFRPNVLEGIAAGRVRLAYRRWRRPRVQPGTRMRTAIGVGRRRDRDSGRRSDRRGGRGTRGVRFLRRAFAELAEREGLVYRIAVRFAGADPRLALREEASLDSDVVNSLRARLDRYDRGSRHGPWTRQVLELIRERPATRAAALAAALGRETLPFKADVRKLKELGLTESLEIGYRISPRGRALLERLDDTD